MFKTTLWATDGSESADGALPYAKALAAGNDRRLAVVHCKEVFVGRGGGYPVLADEDELEAKIRNQVELLREEGIDASFTLASGPASHAAHMIVDVARDVDADVIVVGTRGHAPVTGLLLGGVTQRLLHIARCPILAVPTAVHAGAAEPAVREVAASRN
jgi:nucleotide-binding universal stress UspA family protein